MIPVVIAIVYGSFYIQNSGNLGSNNGYIQFEPYDKEGHPLTFTVTDPIDKNKKKIFDYMELNPTVTIEDITENYGLDYKLGSVFKSEEDV